MGRYKRWSVLILAVALNLALSSSFVLADNALGGETDQQPIYQEQASQSPEDKAYQQEHNRLSALIEAVLKKDLPVEEYRKALVEFARRWKGGSGSGAGAGDVSTSVLSGSKVLGVATVGQETTYYCGPASAYQLLNYKGVSKNPNDGRSLTQGNLASDLGTTTDGTPWGSNWSTTLRNWSGAAWAVLSHPSTNDVWYKTTADVDANWPLIYDTHISSSTAYLPGYDTYEWWHYVTGDGYYWNEYGAKDIHYVDPNRYRSGAYGPHWVSVDTMAKVVYDRGIVY